MTYGQEAVAAIRLADSLDEEWPMRRMANALATEPEKTIDTHTRKAIEHTVTGLEEMAELTKALADELQNIVLKTNRPDTLREVITDLSALNSSIVTLREKLQVRFAG